MDCKIGDFLDLIFNYLYTKGVEVLHMNTMTIYGNRLSMSNDKNAYLIHFVIRIQLMSTTAVVLAFVSKYCE